jgi:hypothetical protein
MGDVKFFYPEFVPNQILTNTQLNQLREHLERQDLGSRVRLAGTGVVCGFSWAVVTSPKPAVRLSGGYGISSDGELIEQCDPVVYTHRRAYADPDRDETGALRYLQWRDPADATHKLQRDIIELIDEAAMAGADPPEDAVALTAANLVGPGAITLNRVLVLYLEHAPVDLNSCLVTSCDNKGLNINVHVRALLVNEADLSAAPDCAAPPVLERIPRMHTIRKPQDIAGAAQLTEAFANIVVARAPALGSMIMALFDTHAAFLDIDGFAVADPLAGKLVGTEPAQYRHDALADFASAYNEAALAAHSLVQPCCPVRDFPRHLMLGALDGTPFFRNEFLPAAIRNVAQGELQDVRMQLLRLRAMVAGLDFGAHPGDVAVVPSHTAAHALGSRARPYYFSSVSPEFWRPRPRCAVDADWPWRRPATAVGLDTDYAEASWLRIEGHVGKSHAAAAAEIGQQRDAGNAEFCLLRTYFADRAEEESALRRRVAELLARLAQVDAKGREAIAKAIAKGGGAHLETIAEFAQKRAELLQDLDKASALWIAVREQRELHCDASALARDYLEARSELFCIGARLLGMLQRLRIAAELADAEALLGPGLQAMRDGILYALVDRILGAVVSAPQAWDTVDEIKTRLPWDRLPELDDLERLRLALRLALQALHWQVRGLLEGFLPKTLSRFDHELFAARYRELVRGLLEFRLWSGALGTVLTGTNGGLPTKEGDSPLSEVEAGGIEADLLALTRSCLAVRLATIFSSYEALRRNDLSLYRNLAKTDGLEHGAGVAKGGSFILVCDTSGNSGTVLADLSLARCLPCCCELDAGKLCLPPLALPDARVVRLQADAEGGYQPVRLLIMVGANDYDLNGAGTTAPEVALELLSETSESGAKLAADSKTATVSYELNEPVPGVVDRFRYRLRIKGECDGEAIGEVSIVFAVAPLFTGRIEGDVLTDEAGRPGAGAIVTMLPTDLKVEADAQGRFAFELVPPGTYELQASLGALRSRTERATVTTGATADVQLRLEQPALLDGTVLVRILNRVEGAPIRNAAVTLKADTGPYAQTIVTGASGDAVFRNVPVGTYRAVASAQGFMLGAGGPFPLAGGQTQVQEIRLMPAGIGTPTVTIDHAVETLGLDVVEATVRVRKTLADRHAKFARVFNNATDDPRILTSAAFVRGTEFMATGLADTARPEAETASDYKETSGALAAVARESTGKARVAHQEMLAAVSLAYLDHVAATHPAELTHEVAREVRVVVAALKSAGVSPAAVQSQWSGDDLARDLGVTTAAGIGTLLG